MKIFIDHIIKMLVCKRQFPVNQKLHREQETLTRQCVQVVFSKLKKRDQNIEKKNPKTGKNIVTRPIVTELIPNKVGASRFSGISIVSYMLKIEVSMKYLIILANFT